MDTGAGQSERFSWRVSMVFDNILVSKFDVG